MVRLPVSLSTEVPAINTNFPYVPQKDMSHQNGKPLEEIAYEYIEGNSKLDLLQRKIYTYEQTEYNDQRVRALNYKHLITNSHCRECRIGASNTYDISPIWHRLSTVTDEVYDNVQGTTLSTTTNIYLRFHFSQAIY